MHFISSNLRNPIFIAAGALGVALIGTLGYRLVKKIIQICSKCEAISHIFKTAQPISHQVESNFFVKVSQADLSNPEILNNKIAKACKTGFFYLEIPQEDKLLIDHAIKEANSFYQNEKYTNLHLEGFSGYHDRKEHQVESFYLEQKFWSEHLTPDLCKLATKMKVLGIDLLKKTLKACDIPEIDYEKGSGGATEDKAQMHFVLNHYRSDRPNVGIKGHRDFGQITVLYINKPGLQAKVNDKWLDVLPLHNHFVINFGQALETFVNNPNKLIAAWHRVPQVASDRISFGIFADNNNESLIYKREKNGELRSTDETYKTYLTNSFKQHNVESN